LVSCCTGVGVVDVPPLSAVDRRIRLSVICAAAVDSPETTIRRIFTTFVAEPVKVRTSVGVAAGVFPTLE
jgi:hypothetical protein